MYLLLLAFGAILTVAGIVLAAFGVSVHYHTFDTSIMTPGVVGAVGGLLLIGLGLALRVLARIERALAVRPVQRTEPGLAQPEPALLLSPSPTRHSQAPPPVPGATTAFAAGAEKPVHEAVEKSAPAVSPLIARLEASRVIAGSEVSRPTDVATPLPTSVDFAVAQIDKTNAAKRKNGAAVPGPAPRFDLGARSTAAERPPGPSLDALWPRASRLGRAPASPAPVQPSAGPASERELLPEPATDAADAPVTAAADPVSVLKSGVVDGMAYTLYSDGSIEAQLPQGTLRFGSITELRHHIEQSA